MTDLDAARRDAIRLLCQAQADDRLSVDAFEGRLEQVKHAPNQATLDAIVADLEPSGHYLAPVPDARPLPTGYPAAAGYPPSPVAPAEYLRLASVFGTTKRAGSWTVPLEIDARVLFGEMTLDLRDAVFGADVIDIHADATLGSFTLIVPAGTQVENEIAEVLSSSSHSTRSARGARPNGLLVRLHGKALLASIEIKEKPPSQLGSGAKGFFGKLLGSGE